MTSVFFANWKDSDCQQNTQKSFDILQQSVRIKLYDNPFIWKRKNSNLMIPSRVTLIFKLHYNYMPIIDSIDM